MSGFALLPPHARYVTDTGQPTKEFYIFLHNLFNASGNGSLPGADLIAVSLGASPAVYTATQGGSIIVSGGTVSLIEFSRDEVTWVTTGLTAGMFHLSDGDSLRVTYSVKPGVTFVPP